MRARLTWGFGVLLLSGWLGTPAQGAEPFRFPEGKFGKGELKYINDLPVLTVEGTPEEIGAAAGALALKPGARMAGYPEELLTQYGAHFLWRHFIRAGERMASRFPDDYRTEMDAMAGSSGVNPVYAVVGNTIFDLKKLFACSAMLVDADRSATGAPLLGRNLDYPSLGYAQEYSLVTVYKPAGAKHAFVSIGFPGLVGCLSGMNDAGLSLSILEVFQVRFGERRFDATGTPYALCYRRLLEECSTIEEARRMLESMHRTSTTNLVLADKDGVATFEITPERVIVRPAQNGVSSCTNHFTSDVLRPRRERDQYRSNERFQILRSAEARPEKLGLDELHRALHAARQPEETMQTMIFEPAKLRLHLAIGSCPSSACEMKTLDLEPLFKAASGEKKHLTQGSE
jgi:isopenicillin-N N-acyltransferase-like protein